MIYKWFTVNIKNGAVMLPIRAKKPQVPNAAPRQIVGNNSELNIIMAANAEMANDFVVNDKILTIMSIDNKLIKYLLLFCSCYVYLACILPRFGFS